MAARKNCLLRAQQAVLPGCHFATLMLQLMLLTPLDAAQAAFPLRTARGVHIGAVVDDAGLHKVGPSGQ
eukprot:445432-Pyramimonas_sp.AAC.1